PSCPAPSNDGCVNALPLTATLANGTASTAPYTTLCASVDGPTAISGPWPVQGVWFSFNSGAYGHARLRREDTGLNSAHTASTREYALRNGTCWGLGAQRPVAALADAAGTRVLEVSPNTDCLRLVYNTGGSGVAGSFGLMLEQPAHD